MQANVRELFAIHRKEADERKIQTLLRDGTYCFILNNEIGREVVDTMNQVATLPPEITAMFKRKRVQ